MNNQESNSRELNKDYIAVVHKSKNGKLSYKEIDIEQKDTGLISLINSCSQHEDIPLTDIEEVFSRLYSGKPSAYSYCLPFEYSDTFIEKATYPKLYNKVELEQCIEKEKNEFIKKSIEQIKNEHKNVNETEYTLKQEEIDMINKKADVFISELVNSLKEVFAKQAIRYIMADSFKEAIHSVKSDKNNIMFSTEVIGWTTYNYQVNKELSVRVKTNFCYGRSTYFHVTLIFKGVELLAYSKLVQYYYANMLDFLDCTESYARERSSWETALQFVVDTANFAIDDEDAFVDKWIIEGVKELVSGLNDVLVKPEYVIGKMLNRKLDDKTLYAVRNITEEEISEYKVYRKEMTIAFQAGKISSAILLINNLEKLAELYVEIAPEIEEIKRINRSFFPALHSSIKELDNKIDESDLKLKRFQVEYSEFKRSNWDFFKAIWKIQNNCKRLMDNECEQSAIREYLSINPENESVYAKAKDYMERIAETEDEIKRLNLFRTNLYRCAQLICDYGLAGDHEQSYLSGKVTILQERISIREDHMELSRSSRRIIKYNNTSDETAIIPNAIWVICDSAFRDNWRMKKIKLPNLLKIVGNNAFEGCKNLVEIFFPDSVDEMGIGIFSGCTNLRKIRLSRNIKKIGAWTFADCAELKSIDIPFCVQEIGDRAFLNCKSITDIHLSPSIRSIGEKIFEGCDSLKRIYVPQNKKTTFEKMLWLYTDKIVEEVTAPSECNEETCSPVRDTKEEMAGGHLIHDDESEWLKDIADTELKGAYVDEYGVKYSKDKKVLLDCNCTLDEYKIPSGVVEIREKAFFTAKIGTDHLPWTVKSIGYRGLFSYGIENIECSNANPSFMSWHGVLYSKDMKTLVAYPQGRKDVLYRLPKKTLKIADGVFSTLKDTLHMQEAHSVMSMNTDAYESCGFCSAREEQFLHDNQGIINYPYVIIWPNAKDIFVNECVVSNEMCYVDEKGVVYDWKKKKLLFFHPALRIEDYTVIDGCEEIGEEAFPSFGFFDPRTQGGESISNSIKCITLPASLHRVSGNPFKDCAFLMSIYVPNDVERFKAMLPQELHSKIKTYCKN